jgi:hypothetical protein
MPPLGAPFPPQGPRGTSSPGSQVLRDAPTSCRPSRLASFSFARRYQPVRLRSSLTSARRRPTRLELCGLAAPARLLRTGDDRISQVPGGPLCAYALFMDPGRTARTRPITVRRHGPRLGNNEGSHNQKAFGARSHGFGTRCLRFAPWVTHSGRKTRFPWLANLTGRDWLPAESLRKVSVSVPSHPSSFPKLAWRNSDSSDAPKKCRKHFPKRQDNVT